MTMSFERLVTDLRNFITPSYPDIDIRAKTWEQDPTKTAIYFSDPRFALIYPYQRWHYLIHLIPEDYQKTYLENSVWFELAPGEEPGDLEYPDEELINAITPDVMKCLGATRFFEGLDDRMCPNQPDQDRALCWGDYRNARPILLRQGFEENEHFDIFHVLMLQGGFCDCEILYNVAQESRLKAQYWTARSDGRRLHG